MLLGLVHACPAYGTRSAPAAKAAFSAASRKDLAAEIRVSMGWLATILSSAACASASHGKSRRSGVSVASDASISEPSGRM